MVVLVVILTPRQNGEVRLRSWLAWDSRVTQVRFYIFKCHFSIFYGSDYASIIGPWFGRCCVQLLVLNEYRREHLISLTCINFRVIKKPGRTSLRHAGGCLQGAMKLLLPNGGLAPKFAKNQAGTRNGSGKDGSGSAASMDVDGGGETSAKPPVKMRSVLAPRIPEQVEETLQHFQT